MFQLMKMLFMIKFQEKNVLLNSQRSQQTKKKISTLQCSVLGYTKCDMTMESIPYKGFKMEEKNLPIKKCTEKMKTELHKKKKSECRDVTKQNCVTKWEVLPSGEKVWSGNEDCEPVTWK